MRKIRLIGELIALTAAVVGLSAAYLNFQAARAANEALETTQQRLQAAGESGDISLQALNAIIVDLSKLTGRPANTIEPPTESSTIDRSQSPTTQNEDESRSPDVGAVALSARNTRSTRTASRLRLEEGVPTDLFREGAMYTLEWVRSNDVGLQGADSPLAMRIDLGERKEIPGTDCALDLIDTHVDETFRGGGWAEFRAWCPS